MRQYCRAITNTPRTYLSPLYLLLTNFVHINNSYFIYWTPEKSKASDVLIPFERTCFNPQKVLLTHRKQKLFTLGSLFFPPSSGEISIQHATSNKPLYLRWLIHGISLLVSEKYQNKLISINAWNVMPAIDGISTKKSDATLISQLNATPIDIPLTIWFSMDIPMDEIYRK